MRKGIGGVIQWNPVRRRGVTALPIPKDWNKWVDSLWGPGLPTADKLSVFDTYWNNIDRYFGGFPNLTVDWNALRDHYRPLVEAGVSRGRFYGIMSHMNEALLEHHTWACDMGVDSSFYDGEYLWPHERIPLILYGGYGTTTSGMGVAPMPDSSLFVYRAQEGHPLGIRPGDIILGYDGRRWVDILRAIDSAEVPISRYFSAVGSDPVGYEYTRLNAASMNWWMFDTMDVVKYSTGDTVHFSMQILMDMPMFWDGLYCMDEIPVAGVPEPDPFHDNWCSWGVVEGTSIGYIYLWIESNSNVNTGPQFAHAVRDLMHTTTGLIIDIRGNWGGMPNSVNAGFSILFHENMDINFDVAHRSSTADHFAFTHEASSSSYLLGPFNPTPDIYDHPIAVLTGPACISAGDYTAFRLRFHPMSRSFGKRTNGVPVDGYYVKGTLVRNPWEQHIPKGSAYSHRNGGEYLIHKGVPVDEEVWLTREGAAHGVDDVVQRAIQWITTLTYAHNTALDRYYVRPGVDSVRITTVLTNPLHHTATLSAIVTGTLGAVRDSVLLFNDGLHGDGSAGDSIWGGYIRAPSDEGAFHVSIQTDDITQGTFRRLPNVVSFIAAGPVACVGDTAYTTPQWGTSVNFRLKVANEGAVMTVPTVKGIIRSLDTAATVLHGGVFSVGDIAPGQVRLSSQITIKFSQWQSGSRELPFELVFSSNGIECWTDTLTISVSTTGIAMGIDLPTQFALEQNYPNPFNPSTKIQFSIVNRQLTIVKVFDLLGMEMATLVNEVKQPGTYIVEFDGSNLASGIYLYRLTAGQFVQTRKMLLLH